MSVQNPSPREIAEALSERVFGQLEAVQEMAVALSKNLAGLKSGNVLLVGPSGSGKTTLMQAVEEYLSGERDLAERSTLIRVHANVLAEESASGKPATGVLRRLLSRARETMGPDLPVQRYLDRLQTGIVFLDEVDKIRASVGGITHVSGIRAQEALLTLMENERVTFDLPSWAGGGVAAIDARSLLFVGGGAFEGLYDSVFDRVTIGSDRGALKAVTVLGTDEVKQEMNFNLRDWVRAEDFFDYGLTPQFYSRFDSIILLNRLGEDELVRILLESVDSPLLHARQFFEAHGVQLVVSPAAVRRVAVTAADRPRIGARALREVFRDIIRRFEFDPQAFAQDGSLIVDLPEVEQALARESSWTEKS